MIEGALAIAARIMRGLVRAIRDLVLDFVFGMTCLFGILLLGCVIIVAVLWHVVLSLYVFSLVEPYLPDEWLS